MKNSKKLNEERKSRRDPEVTGRKTDGENRADEEVKPARRGKREGREIERDREREREADGGGEEADRNSLGGQHWHSQRGTAGRMES